jgi:hypothetical protein
MTHTWKAEGSHGRWVHHSSGGSGSDSIGVGLGEDVLGPFSSQKLARTVACALTNAYAAGLKDARVKATPRKRRLVNGPDPYDPTTDDGTVAHDGLDMPGYGD